MAYRSLEDRRRYRQNRKEQRRAEARAYLRRRRLRDYGLTEDDVAELSAQQNGRCRICERLPPRLVIDHDHVSGIVRGLLCDGCNRGLGFFEDDAARLSAAVAYLKTSASGITLGIATRKDASPASA